MSNFSCCYFSFNREVPTFLPKRLRLPDKSTRSSADITLEEVQSFGYLGPIEVPTYDEKTQYLLWDTDNIEFKVQEKTEENLAIIEDQKTRTFIQDRINQFTETLKKEVTSPFVLAARAYISALETLLSQTFLISEQDIPFFNFTGFTYVANSTLAVDKWLEQCPSLHELDPALWYTKFGFIPNFPPDLVGYFTPPSDWVKKIDLNVLFITEPSKSLPSGSLVSVSGYNINTQNSTYPLPSGQELSLIQDFVFFPQ